MSNTSLTITRRSRCRCGIFIGVCLYGLPFLSYADDNFLDNWNIVGSNTLRGSLYDAEGLGAASPYPFEGDKYFNEFNVYLNKQNSHYDKWRAEVSGVFNINDQYRASDFGVVPERLSLVRENGEGNVPYRVEFGDLFSYFSNLTLQNSLKGFQFEAQPSSVTPGRYYSIIFSSGANESNWRDLTPTDDYTNALSWLIQDQEHGTVSFNAIHNFRNNNNKLGTLDRSQIVLSVAGAKNFSLSDHDLIFEAEFASFHGDHNGTTDAASGQDRDEAGYFMQLSGQSNSLPWTYEARFQHYGQDYQPRGAVVTPNRRSVEAFSNWRFDSGILMRGRLQLFEDAFETTNKLRTRTYGVNFSGPIVRSFWPDASGSLDAFIQNRNDETFTVSSLVQTINLNLSKPLPDDWNGRLGFFFQNTEDRTAGSGDLLTRQLSLAADHSITIAGFRGYVTPGLILRTLRKGNNDSMEYNPTLAVRLNRGPHAINFDYGSLVQNRFAVAGGVDIGTHTLNMDYRYRKQQNTYGIEANLFGRDPQPGDSTEAYRISAFWTYEFDRPVQAVKVRAPAQRTVPALAEVSISLTGLTPGAIRDDVEQALTEKQISGGVNQSGYIVYEFPILPNIFQRQRLGLKYSGGLLEESVVIIDFDQVGDRDSTLQVFERVRESLIRQLGSPTRTIEEGIFAADFQQAINDQRLIRIIEWETSAGTIRFGIPRRLDGHVRMEIQHARRFQQPSETLWSIEAIR